MANAALIERDLTLPDNEMVAQAADAVRALEDFLKRHRDLATSSVTFAPGDDAALQIPGAALEMLIDVLAHMAVGDAVGIAPVHPELTVPQAADLMDVPRRYLEKLLDDRKLPYRRVGKARRVLLCVVADYQRREAALLRRLTDELAAEARRLRLDY
ncbi:excisionase family DNA-binding protein [Candidatus Poriferisodalis sp.]|uniref:excisionase family DNA-binding protein n=1 Tax=Candidatus Poriferisodalis sp. TaxID=3101277 RepID=UPI003D135054